MPDTPNFARPDIPIVGGFVDIHGVSGPTVVIGCRCGHPTPLIIPGLGSVATCPSCGKRFTIAGLKLQNGNLQVGVGVVSGLSVARPQ